MDAAFGSFLLFEQIESDMAKDSQVFRSLIFADTTMIFIESHIQNPMQFIFNCPVFANNFQNSFCIAGQTGDIKPNMLGLLVAHDPCTNDHGNTLQTSPVLHITDQVQIFRVGGAPTFSHFNSAMSFVECFCISNEAYLKFWA